MTFLQPILLWGLLAAATPILIHFVNRMRHRPMPWGAMLFLARARRSSTKFAKLRRFLILACRALALAMVALLLSRPL
ncbi:MAG: BatA domain-containing protein, partial [Lentisphaeria bacterium]|nr:BatA domain-containing protein [Lentisphaeria bacterium]